MFNDAPSYRVGEARRATPKGLARLPNIYPSEMYQLHEMNAERQETTIEKEQHKESQTAKQNIAR